MKSTVAIAIAATVTSLFYAIARADLEYTGRKLFDDNMVMSMILSALCFGVVLTVLRRLSSYLLVVATSFANRRRIDRYDAL
jgi:ABC-type spermidine/putrescine transport system permease subunit II